MSCAGFLSTAETVIRQNQLACVMEEYLHKDTAIAAKQPSFYLLGNEKLPIYGSGNTVELVALNCLFVIANILRNVY